jgi:transposase InsO family protein
VSFIDDYSKFSWIYPLKFKSEVFSKFVEFQKLVERLFDRKIITVQTDWGREYQKLHDFFSKIGITHHVSCPYAHQQNGSAEWKHRHIVEVGLSLLAHASMPKKYWDMLSSQPFTSLTERLAKYLAMKPLLSVCSSKNQTTSISMFLAAPAGQIFTLITIISSNSVHNIVFFLDSVAFTRGSSVLILNQDVSTYQEMSHLMKESSYFFELHPNVGHRLQEEINLLPFHLLNPSIMQLRDHVSNNCNPAANPGVSTGNQEHVHIANTEET